MFFFAEDVFSGSYANSTYLWSPVFPASLSMPCARSRHSVCVWGGGLFVYGGRGTRGTLKDFWRYDLGMFFWETWENFQCSGLKAEPSYSLLTFTRNIHNRLLCLLLKSMCKGFLSYFACFDISINYAHSRLLSFQRSTIKKWLKKSFLCWRTCKWKLFGCGHLSFLLAFNMTGSNTWDHVTVEGNVKPPSLQEHTALAYKVTGICRSGWNERRIRKHTKK